MSVKGTRDQFVPATQTTAEVLGTSAGFYEFDPPVSYLNIANGMGSGGSSAYCRFNEAEGSPATETRPGFDVAVAAAGTFSQVMPFDVKSVSLWVPSGGTVNKVSINGCNSLRN